MMLWKGDWFSTLILKLSGSLVCITMFTVLQISLFTGFFIVLLLMLY